MKQKSRSQSCDRKTHTYKHITAALNQGKFRECFCADIMHTLDAPFFVSRCHCRMQIPPVCNSNACKCGYMIAVCKLLPCGAGLQGKKNKEVSIWDETSEMSCLFMSIHVSFVPRCQGTFVLRHGSRLKCERWRMMPSLWKDLCEKRCLMVPCPTSTSLPSFLHFRTSQCEWDPS